MVSMHKQKRTSFKPRRFLWALIVFPLLLGMCVGIYMSIVVDLPPAESISFFTPPVATKVFDNNNNLITEFFIERRELADIEQVPSYLKDGLICIEDKQFYKHWGVDILGLMRAFFTNLLHMKVVQGGSTITMQLARNMFLTLEQTMLRKLKEMALAIRIERVYTKDEILEKYFNQINFGQGRYGVATAAKYYFEKDISELSIHECALLIAIAKSPERYSPHKHPEKAKQRRDFVLTQMSRNHVITEQEYEEAVNTPLSVVEYKEDNVVGRYFLEEVRKYLELKYGPEFLYRSGARIYTTMDFEIQKTAEKILEKHLAQIEKDYRFENTKAKFDSLGLSDTITASPYLQDALVILDYHTGEVKALIGGRDFSQSKFNRATQARRQAGSAFKVFVFTAAVDNGFTSADIVLDLPIVIEIPGVDSIYRPSNYDRRFLGPITVRKALALSRNLAAIRLIRNIGPELVVKYAHDLGVESPLLPVVSLALGSCEVNLLEMVSAMGTIAALGERVQPILIRKITNREGTIIEINDPLPETRLSPRTSYVMINLMRAVVAGGTGYKVQQYYSGPAAGKTGTTNNYSDAWFIGFTPKYACGIWVGYDNNDRIFRGASGGVVSAPIWGEVMAGIDPNPSEQFPRPSGLITCTVCSETGLLARESCPQTREEVFVAGTAPRDSCDLHGFDTHIDYQNDFDKIDPSVLEGY
jgi:penicillin-binding protein 1A